MEEVKIGQEVGHLFGGKPRNSGLGLRHPGQDRGSFIPHAGGNLGQAFIKVLCFFLQVATFFSSLTLDGMAFDTSLGGENLLPLSGISWSDESSLFGSSFCIRLDIF